VGSGPAAVRLPLRVDPAELRVELAQVEAWVEHHNQGYHDGGWSGAALRAAGEGAGALHAHGEGWADTPLLERCPAVRSVLAALGCPTRSVRLLRLAPGSFIREHRDPALGLEDGEARLHAVIDTNPGVGFWLDGARVPLAEGELWYLDVRRPHRVRNQGDADRVHLVIDCVVDDRLRALLAAGEAWSAAVLAPAAEAQGGITELRRRAGDEALIALLWDVEDRALFERLALQAAASLGLQVTEADLRARERALVEEAPAGWIPATVELREGRWVVDWLRPDGEPPREPFFDDTLSRLRRRPYNRLFGCTTPIEALERVAPRAPTGLILHASRCGSTLVAQALAACAGHVVLSEPPALDGALRAARAGATEAQQLAWVRGVVAALGQGDRVFVKLDAWATLDLPLLRRAFPSTPWVFLAREPWRILASHRRERGTHMTPGLLDPALWGLTLAEALALGVEGYGEHVLAKIFDAAAASLADGGLLVHYRELPEALETRVASHLGVSWTEAERAAMRAAAQRDAKRPGEAFVPVLQVAPAEVGGPADAAYARLSGAP
jgi:hypothetical protein